MPKMVKTGRKGRNISEANRVSELLGLLATSLNSCIFTVYFSYILREHGLS